MLELLNRYSHGLVSIPILHTLRETGCLASLEETVAFSSEQLARELSANRGYLDVALRMMVCLEWIRPTQNGSYDVTPELANFRLIPERIMDLYNFPFDRYVQGDGGDLLEPWLARSERRWDSDHRYLPDYLDGLFMPLLLALKTQGRLELVDRERAATLRLDVAPAVRGGVERLLVARGWASRSGGELQLSRAGRFVIDRILITAALASYRPMLARAPELLFGDAAGVFALDPAGHETHLDRTLNVIGSGFQHEKYFAALSEVVVRLFDHERYSSQPRYIADMGCGDGSLLRRLYETVRDGTRRGRALDRHPLVPIAVDFNEKALAAASRTLGEIDHIALKGDIGDPVGLLRSLRARGIEDLDQVLHVRSFLDHDRPYREPEDRRAAASRPRFGGSGIYIDADGGLIPPGEMIQSTVEHLQRWAQAVSVHGLIALEVHCLPAQVTARFLDESESFHFDAYQSLSHQYLLEAETFLLCAAEAGLFCREGRGLTFPRNMPFTRISLHHFELRPYTIRHAWGEELPALRELEEVWPRSRRDPDEAARPFETGLSDFPEGRFVLLEGGRIVTAVCCAQEGDGIRIVSAYALPGRPASHVRDLLRLVEQYWGLKRNTSRVVGIEECGAAFAAGAAGSLAGAVARDVATSVAGYPFSPGDDPRAAEHELGRFSFRWLLAHLQRMGALREAGEVHELDELERLLGIAPKYGRYFEALIRRLAREGLVTVDGRKVEATDLVRGYALAAAEEIDDFKRSFQQRYPACAGLLNLTACCLSRYEEIVTGRVDVADVLFQDGDMEVFAEVFRGDAVSDYFNRIVADAVRSAVVRGASSPRVRILEIGAGTGGTTTALLEALEPLSDRAGFCFSDISPSFVRHARRRFAERYPWIEYRTLNIEEDLARQGFEAHGFDVVVAANVLHDTRDIELTLEQTRRLLKPGGLLILNEYTSVKDCLSFSGALLHGWWLFEDPERRLQDSCLLSVPQWGRALANTGFTLVEPFTLPTQSPGSECSQSVMLCAAEARPVPFAATVPRASRDEAAAVAPEAEAGAGRGAGQGKSGIIGKYIEQDILTILGEERSAAYLAQRPLMEMGLDSIELVELKLLMGRRFDVKLSPAFLFEHETQEKIADALAPLVSDEQLRETPPAEPADASGGLRPAEGEGEVAIVGVACRFPGGAASPEAFWELLERGDHGIVPLPPGRWQWPASVDVQGRQRGIDRGGFLERIDEFDAQFFRTSPREAELMDPQQRLLLELSWETLEDAGHRPSELSGRRVGVFVGVCHADYRDVLVASGQPPEAYVGAGSACSMLANRLSYFYDFKGPSLAIDTACSSSLFALHDAMSALRRGDCEEALVGAVNLLCSPMNSIAYYQAGMLSPTGECRAFDAAADGFVRGEGGAMLLLKPLALALADGDSIYGLVKGTAVNHGGQAASLTAPKPEAQAAVVEAAWLEAGAAPDSVAYIEAHGTGTRLGDPVEISGLSRAFQRLYRAWGKSRPSAPHCGLGSVKANLGHLEGAAGMAGLIKILLSIEHGRIPGTRNFRRLNPDIDLDGSPFYIVERKAAWPALRDERGRELPRRAGVSSFGFGGANAHVAIEEYRRAGGEATAGNGPFLIPLSAKSSDRLTEQARRLLGFLEQPGRRGVSLESVAYTLQAGREPMEERVAFLAASWEELIPALGSYAAGERAVAGCHRGNPGRRQVRAGAPRGEWSRDVEAGLAGRDLAKLASLWVLGAEIEWERLYPHVRPRRAHLPAYPFARERYWVSKAAEPLPGAGGARLHPLVHQNTSDLGEQRFSSVFTGQEFFLADHRIEGRRLLPGVAYLEMAREAVARAAGEGRSGAVRLRNVVWLRPFAVGQSSAGLQIRLFPAGGEEIGFEIYSGPPGSVEEETVHAQGTAILGVTAEAPRLDVSALAARYGAGTYPAEKCYSAFAARGIEYGAGHRGIEALHVDADGVLAKLSLPSAVAETGDDFILHPSLLDSALQATIGFTLAGAGEGAARPALPFELQDVEIHGSCTASMWAVARQSSAAGGEARIGRYDIDLCDQSGSLRVRLRGLAMRRAGGTAEELPEAVDETPLAAVAVDAGDLCRKVRSALTQAVSRLLRCRIEDLDPDVELGELGFDSIAFTELTAQLNEDYGLELTPTVFFEHPTLEKLSRHLARTHQEVMAAHLSPRQAAQPVAGTVKESPAGRVERRSRFFPRSRGGAAGPEAPEPIAIIGMSGRFPMAGDVEELWENLLSGRDCISEIPPQRWDWRAVYGDPGEENRTTVKWGGFIAGIEEFDPLFFHISPREAQLMDPQQRLLMIYIWKAIEDAGYSASSLSGSNTGIFVGTGLSDYGRLIAQSNVPIEGYTATGTVASVGPNRMSYFLNLHGPSEPVETACSSSLVAIHRAVSAMRSGECEMAIVGGVNTILTPDLHISFEKAGMLSADGRCKTFSDRADGYVRSEGVGVLFLKKLRAAEEAGDHIYGVILGSAENHGGRTGSLTAPSPQAQAELLKRAYTEAAVDPASVSYIEAHGTGTELGDPIEVDGLKAAFRDLYRSRGAEPLAGHCGLGSVKSNVGHLELAAGVVGVIKVLLQMKHRTLVRSLHCDTVNPYIQLEGSPFYIVRETMEWRARRDERGEPLPRRAGVSSFGFGGVNAHVVLEEHIPPAEQRPGSALAGRPAIVVLSARDRERLRERVAGLLAVLRKQRFGDGDLASIAYTLQVGREAMDERLGLIVSSVSELEEKLQAFLDGEDRHGLHRGQDQSTAEALRMLIAEEDFHGVVERWIEQGRSEKLLDLWLKGMKLDWERLHGEPKPRRVSLPTYPFARERFWIPETRARLVEPVSHPLLNQRDTEILGYRFSTLLTGDEPFLADHVIQGRRVLPAVVYLEMARAAVERASGVSLLDGGGGNRGGVWLRSVVWMRPFSAGPEPAWVHLRLTPEGGGDLSFEIYGDADNTGRDTVVYGQGRAGLSKAAAVPVLDLAALRARCDRLCYSAEDCYGAFASMGYHYGPAQRGIAAVYVGTDELLARLTLPAPPTDPGEGFILHPSLADSAIQATVGFLLADRRSVSDALQPALPFELQSAEIFRACTSTMWASIRRGDGKFDIDLCDETGRLSARFRGWATRPLGAGAPAVEAASAGEMILTPSWEPVRIEPRALSREPLAVRMAVVGGTDSQRAAIRRLYPGARPLALEPEESGESMREKMVSWGEIGHLVWIAPHHLLDTLGDDSLIAAQREGALFCFRLIKALLAAGYGDRALTWSVLTTGTQAIRANELASPAHASVHGLIGSLAKEYAHWNVRLMDLPTAGDGWPWEDLFAVPGEPHGNARAYRDRCWYRQELVPYRPAMEAATTGRPGEVYVVIGGAGGIGSAWSEALLRQSKVQLVWIGRRPKDGALQARLDRLAGLGPAPLYIAADATDREQLAGARATILRELGRIDGLVHAALVLQDQSLAKMPEDALKAALAAKVDVCVRLAQVFGQDPLRFVLFFSSFNAFSKSAGQSNYVAGCTFQDAFARRLAVEWPCRVRVINWGYWGSVGAVASERYRSLMARRGFGSIELPGAMRVLDRLLSGPAGQLAYLVATGPPAVEGVRVRSQEWATHFAAALPSCIESAGQARRIESAEEWPPSPAWSLAGQEIEESLGDLLWAQLQSLRLFTEESGSREELQARAGIPDRFARWLEHSIGLLEARGYIARSGPGWQVSSAAPMNTEAAWQAWEARKQGWLRDARWKPPVQLAEAALRALPDIMTGRCAAADILFADLFDASSSSSAAEVLRHDPVARFCNRTLADAVARYVEERQRRDPGCQIRILEIGVGTGATSEAVFDALSPHAKRVREYTYTSTSMASLAAAKKSLSSWPAYLRHEVCDVELPLAEQGIAPDSYDLVIASNALHATRDIRGTLRNIKTALRTNGLLLINEISASTLFNHLTFGLLDGWWLFADPELRVAGSPALRPETWRAVLEQEGFRSVLFPAADAHGLGQQVLVAESDGFVRQSAVAAAPPRQRGQEMAQESRSATAALAEGPGRPASMAEIMSGPRDAATGHLLAVLRLRAAETLGLDLVALDSRSRPFTEVLLGELGMDSLSSSTLRNALRRDLGVDIPVQRILGEKVRTIVEALYDQLLLQHVSTQAQEEDDEDRETYVF
jgi:acyl transferase domain-containing protein/SAM-dependent methyltransferase